MIDSPVSPDFIRMLYAVYLFGWGACTGSLLNVVILRLPRGESLIEPPSHCPACGARVRLIDLTPILNWLWLRGHCRDCRAPIHPRYPLIELATALIIGWIAYTNALNDYGILPNTGILMVQLIAACLLIPIAIIDLEEKRIPLILPGLGLVLALFASPWLPALWLQEETLFSVLPSTESLLASVNGMALGGIPLGLLSIAGCLRRIGSRSGAVCPRSRNAPLIRREDALLAALFGALFGPSVTALVLPAVLLVHVFTSAASRLLSGENPPTEGGMPASWPEIVVYRWHTGRARNRLGPLLATSGLLCIMAGLPLREAIHALVATLLS